MATFEERQQQHADVEIPAAYRAYVAEGIRKKFGDSFDIPQDWTPEQVIQKHHSRFGVGMSPSLYEQKIDETYGKGFTPPPAPAPTVGERVSMAGEGVKEFAKGIIPYIVPEAPRVAGAVAKGTLGAAAKAVATKIPVISQIAFGAGHAANMLVDAATASQLEKTEASLQQPNVDSLSQEYYAKLQPGLTALGHSNDQIMQEARQRALNVARGYDATTTSIDRQIQEAQQKAVVSEPASAAADVFFLGVGAPAVEGLLNRTLSHFGVKAAEKAAPSVVGNALSHLKTGAIIGAGGMGINVGAASGLNAAVEGKSPQEIASALVQGAKKGAIAGAIFGGGLGAGAGTLSGAAERAGARMQANAAAADAVRLARDTDLANARADKIVRFGTSFNPHREGVDLMVNPAEHATSLVEQRFGEQAALSEAGMRAASVIEQRVRLYQDANKLFETTGAASPIAPAGIGGQAVPVGASLEPQPGLAPEPNTVGALPVEPSSPTFVPPGAPAPADLSPAPEQPVAPVQPETSALPETPRSGPNLGRPLGPIETGGRPLAAPVEPNPRLPKPEEQQPAAPTPAEAMQTPAAEPRKARKEAPTPQPTAAPAPAAPVTPPVVEEPAIRSLKSRAEDAIASLPADEHAVVEPDEGGHALKITRVGLEGKTAKPGAIDNALVDVMRMADERQLPINLRITQAAGPKGGKIPVEKQIKWYTEKYGFKIVSVERPLPEGMASAATLRRKPQGKPLQPPVNDLERVKGEMMGKIRAKETQ